MIFKKGDWVFHHFELKQIKQIKDSRITSVTNGYIVSGSYDLKCFPIDIQIKRFSDEVLLWYNKLYAVKCNLNYPRLSDELETRWIDMCENKGNDEYIQRCYDNLRDFCNEIIKKASENVIVEGIKIFR